MIIKKIFLLILTLFFSFQFSVIGIEDNRFIKNDEILNQLCDFLASRELKGDLIELEKDNMEPMFEKSVFVPLERNGNKEGLIAVPLKSDKWDLEGEILVRCYANTSLEDKINIFLNSHFKKNTEFKLFFYDEKPNIRIFMIDNDPNKKFIPSPSMYYDFENSLHERITHGYFRRYHKEMEKINYDYDSYYNDEPAFVKLKKDLISNMKIYYNFISKKEYKNNDYNILCLLCIEDKEKNKLLEKILIDMIIS